MTDELRERLKRLDPMLTQPTPQATAPHHRLELILSPTTTHLTRPTSRTRLTVAAVAVAATALVVVMAINLNGAAAGPVAAPMELSLGEGNSLSSCIVFDTAVLAQMPVAFEGTVAAVDSSTVTLDVDRWYRGGDASQVSLAGASEDAPALIAGFAFDVGRQYLISASEGQVNFCDFSGPSTPELRAAFDEAFGD